MMLLLVGILCLAPSLPLAAVLAQTHTLVMAALEVQVVVDQMIQVAQDHLAALVILHPQAPLRETMVVEQQLLQIKVLEVVVARLL
jgi:hypothetical protein